MGKLGVALNEPSTWRGVVYMCMAFGIHIDPAQQGAIVSAGLAMAAAIGMFVKDRV